MSSPILIIGSSGTGKSTSIESLPPKETFINQVVGKPLPFRGWRKNYTTCSTENPEGNLVIADNVNTIKKVINNVSLNRPEIKNLIIDDTNYIMSNSLMRKATEKGFDKFNEIASDFHSLLDGIGFYREDLNIIFFAHSEQKDDGKVGIKTAGKMLDSQFCIEGLFTIVMETFVDSGNYSFITQNNGRNCAKSPKGMFTEHLIPNDLLLVTNKIKEYEEDAPEDKE